MIISDEMIPILVMTTAVVNACICYIILNRLLQIGNIWYQRAVLGFGCLLLCGMVIYVGDIVNLPPTLIVFVSAVLFSCKDNFWKKLVLALLICSTVLSFNALFDSYIHFISTTARILYWIILLIIVHKTIPSNTFDLSVTYWKLMLLLTLTPLGIVISVVVLQGPYALNGGYADLSCLVLLLISSFSLFGLFWTIAILSKQQKLEEEQYLWEMNQNYYKNLEQQQFEIRRLRHDMANHLQTLSSLPPQEVSGYLSALQQDNAFYGIRTFCENSTINAVLNSKYAQMKALSVDFDCQADVHEKLPYAPTDICALFSNFMDNALEACEKLEPQDRRIRLQIKTGKGLLAIQVQNSCPKAKIPVPFEKSTKKDAPNHGYGLKSIREIVNRYCGNMEIKQKDDSFNLFLYLPL